MTTRGGRWTDGRLDDLNKKVDGGFARVDADIRDLRGEMRAGYDRLDKKLDAGFARAETRFNWLIGILLVAALSIIGTMIGVSSA